MLVNELEKFGVVNFTLAVGRFGIGTVIGSCRESDPFFAVAHAYPFRVDIEMFAVAAGCYVFVHLCFLRIKENLRIYYIISRAICPASL